MVYNWLDALQLALFPPRCLLCGGPGDGRRDLCDDCAAALPRAGAACPCCALPLADGTPPLACGRCQHRPPPFAATRTVFRYAPPLDRLVQGLKFGRRLDHARLLGGLLADHLAGQDGPRPEMLLPVPLHPRRLRQRGFDQALELARPLARRLDLPLVAAGCRRLRDTAAQSGLPAAERRRNVRGAFAVDTPVGGRRVALIDDVVTTGSTVTALARAVVAAGAERVEVWCVARAARDGPMA
jgi:ComF family protein